MRNTLIGSLLLLGLFAHAQTPFQVSGTTQSDDAVNGVPSRGGGFTVLYDTTGGQPANAFASMSQLVSDIAAPDNNVAAADDFTVTGNGWRIQEILANGEYFNSLDPMGPTGPAASVNVYILSDNAGLPSTTNLAAGSVYAAEGISFTDALNDGDLTIILPGDGVVLPPGTYWLVVQTNQAILGAGQWGWSQAALFGGSSPSAWYQSAALVLNNGGNIACNGAWGQRVATCDLGGPETDLSFSLSGEELVAGVVVDPTNLNLTEDGSAVSYDVYLTAPPNNGETVTVTPSSNDVTEATVSGALNFTAANYDVPQMVTVTPGASGDGNDGDVMGTISNNVAGNVASGYDSVTASDVTFTNVNIDGVKTITVDPATGLVVSEDGVTTASFDVTLTQAPSANVTIDVNADANTQVSLDNATFQNTVSVVSNTTTPVTVYVRGNDIDDIDGGDTPFTVTTDSAVSADAGYNGVDPVDVDGTLTDDDMAGISVSGGPLSTDEDGSSDSFSVVLDSEPTADVTITFTSSDSTEASVDTPSVTFTPGNWNMSQSVDVSGVDDNVEDGSIDYTISTNPASSSDPNYDGVDAADVDGSNADNGDTAGISINPTSGLVTEETDTQGSASFTVTLDTDPIFPVDIPFSTSDATEGLIGTAQGGPFSDSLTLTFTPGNPTPSQTVWIQGQDDALRADGDIAYTIVSGDPTSGDSNYNDLGAGDVADVSVTNNDDGDIGCTDLILTVDGDTIIATASEGCVFDLYANGSLIVANNVIPDTGILVIAIPGGVQEDTTYEAFVGLTPVGLPAQTVPTLGEWAMIVFVMLLMAAGVYHMRRQRLA